MGKKKDVIRTIAEKAKDVIEDIGDIAEDIKDSEVVDKINDGVSKGAHIAAGGVKKGAEKAVETVQKAGEKAESRKAEKEATQESCVIKQQGDHSIVEVKGTDMKVLIPDGYEKVELEKPEDGQIAIIKQTTSSFNQVLLWRISEDKLMPFEQEHLLEGIRMFLDDKQGIVVAETGRTKRGYDYVYTIVKTLKEQFGGMIYTLRIQMHYEGTFLEVMSVFEELGTTGSREAVAMNFARQAELVELGEEGMEGWSEDPYDPSCTEGLLKNLSEMSGLDGLFPDHPLTQAREFALAVLSDELVIIKREADESELDEEVKEEKSPEEKKQEEKEFLQSLFDKEERCRRYTYEVEI